MPVYFIANIKITNEEEYQKYIDGVEQVFSKFKGKYLVVDSSPKLLEGEWNYTRNVVIEFPDETEFESWYNSKEYQSILKHRLKGAICDTILVKS
jgi:uncharacterized protein (DUF1330 family)